MSLLQLNSLFKKMISYSTSRDSPSPISSIIIVLVFVSYNFLRFLTICIFQHWIIFFIYALHPSHSHPPPPAQTLSLTLLLSFSPSLTPHPWNYLPLPLLFLSDSYSVSISVSLVICLCLYISLSVSIYFSQWLSQSLLVYLCLSLRLSLSLFLSIFQGIKTNYFVCNVFYTTDLFIFSTDKKKKLKKEK
jgi:hypothetical protein